MRTVLCILALLYITNVAAMDNGDRSLVMQREEIHAQNTAGVSCSNDDIAHFEACAGTGCLMVIPICGLSAAIISLICFLDATKRFKNEKRYDYYDYPDEND